MKSLLAACCFVLLTALSAQADLAPSKPTDDKISRPAPDKGTKYLSHMSLEIATDPKAYEAKLQISESDLKNLQAALVGAPGNPAVIGGIAFSAPRTMIAGLLMFMAVSAAGILFARSSSFGRTQKALAALFVVAVVLGAAAIITRGNAGPPGSYRWRNLPQALSEGKPTIGSVDIELVTDEKMSGRLKLILPLKKQNSPGEE